MKKIAQETLTQPKTLIVGVDAPAHRPARRSSTGAQEGVKNVESYFAEFVNLVRSCGILYDYERFITIRLIDPAHYITQGKLQDLIKLCEEERIERVILSVPLSVQQERNLGRVLNTLIIDRTQLILEIFERGAVSAEGKIQVSLALLQHGKSRLAGRGLWLSQQSGGIGMRGPGETQKERDIQHIEHLMLKLRRDLDALAKRRDTQRKQRLVRRVTSICLIGYTNAGKSTILNALTKSNVLAEDKLFATLDTTTRELYLDGVKKGVITDTVGFIQQLPHTLVEAFKSTLSELQHAHLLLQVIDASDENWSDHIRVVHQMLEELKADHIPMLYVFNKIDRVVDRENFEQAVEAYNPHVLVSALPTDGLEPLKEFLRSWQFEQNGSSIS